MSEVASSRATRASYGDLFDEAFMRKLHSLALASRRVFRGRLRAERASKKTGAGIEFADHRDYVEGDDIRALDLNVYQRSEKLLLRLYEEEEDLSVHLLVDTSASMAYGPRPKLRVAQRLAAALAYVALVHLEALRVGPERRIDRAPALVPHAAEELELAAQLDGIAGAGMRNLEAALRARAFGADAHAVDHEQAVLLDREHVAAFGRDAANDGLRRLVGVGAQHQIAEAGRREPPEYDPVARGQRRGDGSGQFDVVQRHAPPANHRETRGEHEHRQAQDQPEEATEEPTRHATSSYGNPHPEAEAGRPLHPSNGGGRRR